MPSSELPAGGQRPVVVVAMPEHLREQFFAPATWQQLVQRADVRLLAEHSETSMLRMEESLAEAEVLVTGWGSPLVDAALLDRAPSLRAVIHTGGSVKKIVTSEVHRRGISVSSQAGNNAVPVGEYTLAMVILALKGVLQAAHSYSKTRAGQDVYRQMAEYGSYRRTVGVVGASRVGRKVIALLEVLDVDVVVYDPHLDPSGADALGVRSVTLDELATCSDVVSVHAPALQETHGMIGSQFLSRMRDGATVINTARGALIDEEALIAELRTGRLRAILDVTDPDVPAASSPLWTMPNVLLTPHVAGALGSELQRLGDAAIEELWRAVAGTQLRYEVTWESMGVIA